MKTGARILCVTGPIGAILNYILIIVFRDSIGFIGAPISLFIAHTLGAFLIIRKAVSQPTWSPWTWAAFSGWEPFLKLGNFICNYRNVSFIKLLDVIAIPGIFLACNEIWVFEMLTFIASYFGPMTVTVQTITIQCAMVTLIVHSGMCIHNRKCQ
jgi:Na+-driven multidrug efflux pump